MAGQSDKLIDNILDQEDDDVETDQPKKGGKWKKKGESDSEEEEEEEVKTAKKGTYADQEKVDET